MAKIRCAGLTTAILAVAAILCSWPIRGSNDADTSRLGGWLLVGGILLGVAAMVLYNIRKMVERDKSSQ